MLLKAFISIQFYGQPQLFSWPSDTKLSSQVEVWNAERKQGLPVQCTPTKQYSVSGLKKLRMAFTRVDY